MTAAQIVQILASLAVAVIASVLTHYLTKVRGRPLVEVKKSIKSIQPQLRDTQRAKIDISVKIEGKNVSVDRLFVFDLSLRNVGDNGIDNFSFGISYTAELLIVDVRLEEKAANHDFIAAPLQYFSDNKDFHQDYTLPTFPSGSMYTFQFLIAPLQKQEVSNSYELTKGEITEGSFRISTSSSSIRFRELTQSPALPWHYPFLAASGASFIALLIVGIASLIIDRSQMTDNILIIMVAILILMVVLGFIGLIIHVRTRSTHAFEV